MVFAVVVIVLLVAAGAGFALYETKGSGTTSTTTTTTTQANKTFRIMLETANTLQTPWAEAVNVGLLGAVSALNNTGGYTLKLAALWGTPLTNYVSVASTYANEGYNLIIIYDVSAQSELDTVAPQFPNVQFLGLSSNTGPNFGAGEYDYWQCDYLRGVVAGLATKTNSIGFVSAFDFGTVNQIMNAILAGAHTVNPAVRLYYTFTNSWTDPTAGASAAKSLAALGADVVIGWGDSMTDGMVAGAQAAGIYAEGYLHNSTSLAPSTVLTDVTWNDSATFAQSILAAESGQIGYKVFSFSIYPDHVCSVEPPHNLSPSALTTADQYIQNVETGKLLPTVLSSPNATEPSNGQ